MKIANFKMQNIKWVILIFQFAFFNLKFTIQVSERSEPNLNQILGLSKIWDKARLLCFKQSRVFDAVYQKRYTKHYRGDKRCQQKTRELMLFWKSRFMR